MIEMELHSHSCYSKGIKILHEGIGTPQQMIKQAKHVGLGALAITDHNTVKGSLSGLKYAKQYGVIVIPGIEITSADGDILGLDVKEHIKPYMNAEETIEKIHDMGGIAISPHPFDIKNAGLGKLCLKADAIEVFNALSLDRFSNLKTFKIAKKYSRPMTAASDSHALTMIGCSRTCVEASDIGDILTEISSGRTKLMKNYLSTRIIVDWVINRMQLSYEHSAKYIEQNYSYPKRIVANAFLNLSKRSPGKIDYLFDVRGYFEMVNAFIYGGMKYITR